MIYYAFGQWIEDADADTDVLVFGWLFDADAGGGGGATRRYSLTTLGVG